MSALKVAIFTGEFPVLSETFVMKQIAGLLRNGINVTIVTGIEGDSTVTHDVYKKYLMAERVIVVRRKKTNFERFISVGMMAIKAPFYSDERRCLSVAIKAALQGNLSTIIDMAERKALGVEKSHLGNFDAIVAHFGQNGVRALNLRDAGLIGGPIATVFHGRDMSNHAFIDRWLPSYKKLFVESERLLPISDFWKKRLMEWGAEEEKITVIRMGVDVDSMQSFAGKRSIHEPLRVLSVARLTEKKGIEFAIMGVQETKIPVHYKIIGSGPLETKLKSIALNRKSAQKIEFLGSKSQQQVFEEMESSDVFLLPSITAADGDMEGVPVSIMEAMEKGVVVVATRHSGIPEIIEHGETGFLVSEKSAGEIAKALKDIVAMKDNLQGVRESARAKIMSSFDNTNLDQELINVIEQMVESGVHVKQ